MSNFFQNVETKVYATVAGGGGGAVVGGFVDWLLAVTVWGVPFDAAHAQQAAGAVPAPVLGLVTIVLAAVGAGVAGWLAPHTVRSDVHQPKHAVRQPMDLESQNVRRRPEPRLPDPGRESSKSGPVAYNPDFALAPDKR